MNYALLALVPGFFALNPVAGKALANVMGPWTLTTIRWTLAALVIGAIAVLRGRTERWHLPLRDGALLALLAAGGMAFCSYAAYAGAKYSTATAVGLIYACTTALVAAYEIARGALRPTAMLAVGIAACMVGVLLVLGRGDLSALAALSFGRGEIIATLGMITWAIYTVLLKRVPRTLTPFAQFTIMCAWAAVASVPFTAYELLTGPEPLITRATVPWIAALVLVASVLAFMGYSMSMARNGPVLSAASIALSPLYIAVLSVWLVGETLAWFHFASIALVVAGLIAINWQQARTPEIKVVG
jgi:drug/metabolite transporter (DMT)-like permease